jgi:anaerobic magnesium-protoporphyrin IX monomethyl ester cyclase
MTKVEVIKLIKILKSDTYNFLKIVLGGPDVTYNIGNYLNAGADFLVIGEGEETTFELYNAIMNNGNFEEVDGIAFLENNQIVQTSARTKFKELDELPLPNREAINMYNYLETWKTNHGESSMTISTQRGCPYTCKWCSTAVYGQSYRRRPASQVAQEMKMLKDQYNPDAIWFVDDVFTISHKWLTAFHEEVVKQNAQIRFECITRAERLNDEILRLLKEAGCFRIWIGAESGSQKIIDAMDRRVDVNQVKKVIQDTNAMGIETGTFIMLGYPGETEEDITETIQYLKDANPTLYTITVAYPIKGTSLYNEIEHKITQQPDWETSTDREINFERSYSRKYYQYAVSKVVNEVEFYKIGSKTSLKALKLKTKSLLATGLMKLSK